MTVRELTCLVRLFQACADPALRRRAMELVPELAEWDKPIVERPHVVDDSRPSDKLSNWSTNSADRPPWTKIR